MTENQKTALLLVVCTLIVLVVAAFLVSSRGGGDDPSDYDLSALSVVPEPDRTRMAEWITLLNVDMIEAYPNLEPSLLQNVIAYDDGTYCLIWDNTDNWHVTVESELLGNC